MNVKRLNRRPIGFMEFQTAAKVAEVGDKRDVWYAAVAYDDGAILYYAFDKPYEVRISDLFDETGEHEGIAGITIV